MKFLNVKTMKLHHYLSTSELTIILSDCFIPRNYHFNPDNVTGYFKQIFPLFKPKIERVGEKEVGKK